jgi:hypothetical protein
MVDKYAQQSVESLKSWLASEGITKQPVNLPVIANIESTEIVDESTIVRLDNGDIISKSDYDALSSSDQSLLNQIGIEGFNKQKTTEYTQAITAYQASIVTLSNGDIISKSDYDALPESDRTLLNSMGIDGYNRTKQELSQGQIAAFESSIVRLSNGDIVDKVAYNALPLADQSLLSQVGINGFNTQKQNEYNQQQLEFDNANREVIRALSGNSADTNIASYNSRYSNEEKTLWVQQVAVISISSKLNQGYAAIQANIDRLNKLPTTAERQAYILDLATRLEEATSIPTTMPSVSTTVETVTPSQPVMSAAQLQQLHAAEFVLKPYIDMTSYPLIDQYGRKLDVKTGVYSTPDYDISKVPLELLLSDAKTVNAINTIYGEKTVQDKIYPQIKSFTDSQFEILASQSLDIEPVIAAFKAAGVWDKVVVTRNTSAAGRVFLGVYLDWSALTASERALVAQFYAPRTWQQQLSGYMNEIKAMFIPQAGQPVWQQALIIASDVLIAVPLVSSALRSVTMSIPSLIVKLRSPIANIAWRNPITATLTKVGGESTFIELPKLAVQSPIVQTTLLSAKAQSPIYITIGRGLERAGIPSTIADNARLAASAYKDFGSATKALVGKDITQFPDLASTLKQAQTRLGAADTRFIDSLQGAKLNVNQVKLLEKATGFDGLTNAFNNVNSAIVKSTEAASALEKAPVGTTEYAQALNRYSTARSGVEDSLTNFKTVLTSRYTETPTIEWTTTIANAEDEVIRARQAYQMAQLDAKDFASISNTEKVNLRYEELNNAESTLNQLVTMSKSGELFTPKVSYDVSWSGIDEGGSIAPKGGKPLSPEEINRLNAIRQEVSKEYFERTGLTPLGGTQPSSVAVAERQLSMLPEAKLGGNLELIPNYKELNVRLGTILRDIPTTSEQNIIRRLIDSGVSALAVATNAKLVFNMMLVTHGELRDEFYESIGIASPELHNLIYNPDMTSTKISEVQQQVINTLTTGQPVISQDMVTAPQQDIVVAPQQDLMVSPSVALQTTTISEPRTAAEINAIAQAITGTRTQPETKAWEQTQPEVRTEIQAQTETKTQTKTETRTEAPFRERISVKPKLGIPVIIIGSGVDRRQLTEEEIKGTVGWKQGVMYKYIYPPYGQKDIVNTPNPIKGIPIEDGIRSAYKSIMKLQKGTLPTHIHRDMGIMDIEITTGKGKSAKPKINFKLDLKQKTTAPSVTSFKIK